MKIVEEQVKSKEEMKTHNMPMHLHRARVKAALEAKNKRLAQLGRYEKKYQDAKERITMPRLPWETEE